MARELYIVSLLLLNFGSAFILRSNFNSNPIICSKRITTLYEKPELSENIRASLKSEIAAPFRRFKQFFFVSIIASAGLALFTTIPGVILSLQGSDKVSTDVFSNFAINLAGVAGGVYLLILENKKEQEEVSKFLIKEKISMGKISPSNAAERKAELAKLPVSIQISSKDENVTRVVSLGDLQSKGRQNVIIVAGNFPIVRDIVISAKIEGTDLFNAKDTVVIPIVTGDTDEQLDDIQNKNKKGFAATESLMSAPYIAIATQLSVWKSDLQKEADLAEMQGTKNVYSQGLVLALNREGDVIRRGLGIPIWKELVEQLDSSVKKQ